MPEIEDSAAVAGQIARAENDIGIAVQNGLYQFPVLGRIVLQIGVLNDANIAAGMLNGRANSRSFSLVALVFVEADEIRVCRGKARQNSRGVVR